MDQLWTTFIRPCPEKTGGRTACKIKDFLDNKFNFKITMGIKGNDYILIIYTKLYYTYI